ncbi:hypothetical protein EVAR_87109_1 [Eumeta japonica]|uniref:Uncharacterized protein n=1 Tax=Eumeta variegata TaxID=151549 RepID=A0A4C1ZZL4_EUMVA|nr:hypothetical protein EVAR_87109_1 [Eumeta japonica]
MVFRLPSGKEFKKKEKNQRSSLLDFHEAPNAKNFTRLRKLVSTSSYDLRQFSPKETVASARTERRRIAAVRGLHARFRPQPKECESESCVDRCYCSLKGERTGRCCCVTTHYAHGACSDARTALVGQVQRTAKSCASAAARHDRFLVSPIKENSAVSSSLRRAREPLVEDIRGANVVQKTGR